MSVVYFLLGMIFTLVAEITIFITWGVYLNLKGAKKK